MRPWATFFIFKEKRRMEREFNDQQLVRRGKAEDLKAKGVDPFGAAFKRTASSKEKKRKRNKEM